MNLMPTNYKWYPVKDAPMCPLCGQPVTRLLVERDRTGILGRPSLHPCGHQIKEATYYKGFQDDIPLGWSWEPYPTEVGTQ